MPNFLDKKIADTTLEDICSLVSKYNALIDQIQASAVTTDGKQVLADFFLRSPELGNSRWHEFRFENDKLYIGSNSDGDDPKGFVLDATLSRISVDTLTKIGYITETTLRELNALSEREFLAKGHLFENLAEVTGVNPSLTFTEASLAKSYNVVRNLNVSATSTTATITIADESVGLGQCLSCYVDNNSASNVAITLVSTDTIKYPQNLDTGVSRASNVVTISANKEYLITFLRSKTGIWSFNILEQND